MVIARETVIEIAVASVGVVVFLVAILAIGFRFNDNGLTDQGGLALVAGIALFIVVMTAMGYVLSWLDL